MNQISLILTLGSLLFLWTVPFFPTNVFGQNEKSPYDLSMCIKSALQNNATLLQSQYMVNYYEHGIDIEKSKFGPHLSAHGAVDQFKTNQEFAGLVPSQAGNIAVKDKSGTGYIGGLSLTQPIYSTGSLLGFSAPSIQREKNKLSSQKFTDLKQRDDVILSIVEAYGNVLKSLYALKVKEKSLTTSELIYTVSLSKYKLDLITKSKLLEAENTYINHKTQIAELKSTVEENLADLSNKVGNGIRISKISDDLSMVKKAGCQDDPLPLLEDLYGMAYQKRNDIKAQEAKIGSLLSELQVIKSQRYPELNLMGNYFYRGDFAHSENNLYTWNVFLKLDITLYDFGGVRAAIARQESLIRAEREVLKALKNNVVLQIDQSYQKAESLKAKLIGLQKSIEKDRETLDLYKEKYGKDLVTLKDVLQQQDLLDQDLQTYLETEIDLAMTQLSLKKAMGSDILMCYTN